MLNENFVSQLKVLENRNREGFDAKSGRWFPHASREGGRPTIGYGHKLDDVSPAELTHITRNGVPDHVVNAWLAQDLTEAEAKAARQYNAHRIELNDPRPFVELTPAERHAYTEIVFNVGSLEEGGKWGWPRLHRAFRENDKAGIREQLRRSFVSASGEKEFLDARTNVLADLYTSGFGGVDATPQEPTLSEAAPDWFDDEQGRLNIMIREARGQADGEQTASGF